MATALQKLALDVYEGKSVVFNNVSGEEAIRKAIKDVVGGEWNYYNFMENRYKVYAIISETLSLPLGVNLPSFFDGIANVEHIALNDKKVITVEDTSLFRVARVSKGNSDIRRQKIYGKTITVETDSFEIKIYEEFDRFVCGLIDWTKLIDRVQKSIANNTATKVAEALISGFDAVNNPIYNVKGAFAEDKMDDMIAHVEAKTGMRVALYGTKKALGKVASAVVSDSQKETYSQFGHYGTYKGTDLVSIPQAHVNGTDTFALRDDVVYVLPVGMDIINVVYQGDPIIIDSEGTNRNDRQKEFTFQYNMGIVILVSSYFGIYDID